MRLEQGLFIVFEGGDSAGKTTQTAQLVSWLTDNQISHVVTRQPGGTGVGSEIRRLLLDPAFGELDWRAEALLYAADKAQHVNEVVLPALAEQKIVVCDRYVDSMLAYQGAGRGLSLAELTSLASWATGGVRADLTVLLDVDPAQGVAGKHSKDRLESAGQQFHARVRAGFLALANQDAERYLVLNARLPIAQLAAEVRSRVQLLIEQRAAK